MNDEQLIEWVKKRKNFYLCRGCSDDDAMVLAQIDAIEELGMMCEDNIDDE